MIIKQKLDSYIDKRRDNKIIRVRLEDLKFHPELETAFRIDEVVANRIKEDIQIHGDNTKAHPIHIFKLDGAWYVSDGHTRVTVLRSLGFKYTWAQVHNFKSVKEALCYCMAEQYNRRNENDADLLARYLVLREQTVNGKKLSADELASKLNKSRRHIYKLQKVAQAPKQKLEELKKGRATINSIYQDMNKHAVSEVQKVEKSINSNSKNQTSDTEVKLVSPNQEPKPQSVKIPKPSTDDYGKGFTEGLLYVLDCLNFGKSVDEIKAELSEVKTGAKSVDSLKESLIKLKESHEQKQAE